MRWAAHKYVHARRKRENHRKCSSLGNGVLARLSREGVHSRVHGPAHYVDGPCALTGGLGGSSRTARATTRAQVCPLTPAHACASRLVEPLALTHMLTRVCARDAQAMPRPSSPPPPPASPASLPTSPLPPRRLPSPPGAVPMHALGCVCLRRRRGPDSVPRGRSARILGVCSLGAEVGIDGVVLDRSGACWCDL